MNETYSIFSLVSGAISLFLNDLLTMAPTLSNDASQNTTRTLFENMSLADSIAVSPIRNQRSSLKYNQRVVPLDLDLEWQGNKYDILILAQSWPQTSCLQLNNKWKASENSCSPCKMPKSKTSWTLHGLWPSSLNGIHPSYCNDLYQYNPKLLSSSLRKELEQKWPSFNLRNSNDNFWKHEWKKHGTCALDLPSTNSLPKYFLKSIKMLDVYNMGSLLANFGVVPDREYGIGEIFNAIKKKLKVKVIVKCATNTVSNEQYLAEIQICFNKEFELTDCSEKKGSNCKRNEKIIYPENLKSCQNSFWARSMINAY